MNFYEWLRGLVYNGNLGISNFSGYIFVTFGCVLVCMSVGFIFKFLLKLMD